MKDPPTPNEEEREKSASKRQREEDRMRGLEHDDPSRPREKGEDADRVRPARRRAPRR
jgi:hypothetical protein